MRKLYAKGILLVLASSLALTSCAIGQNPMRRSMQQMTGDTLPIGVDSNQLPDPGSSGAKLLSRYCSQCHRIPSPRLHTAQEWPSILARMEERMGETGSRSMGMMRVSSPSQGELEIMSSYLVANSMVGLDPQQLVEVTGIGADAFKEVCSTCHALPDPRQHTGNEWPAVVDRMTIHMRSLGRVVPNDPELKQVVTFLQSNAAAGQ